VKRICVDCRAMLGVACPHCGDVAHKTIQQNSGRLRCGICSKTFEQDSTTGGFCELCLKKRLARALSKAQIPKFKRIETGGIDVAAFTTLAESR
jgi:protein-arginine kinase activator protein McsA